MSAQGEPEGEKAHFSVLSNLAESTYRKNLFFFEEFSITNSFDRPFFPSSTMHAFSLVSLSPVVIQISYSVREKNRPGYSKLPQDICTEMLLHKTIGDHSVLEFTGLLVEVQVVVVSTGELSHYLSVVIVLGKPAITGETKCFVHDLILHINILQVPARSNTWMQQDARDTVLLKTAIF